MVSKYMENSRCCCHQGNTNQNHRRCYFTSTWMTTIKNKWKDSKSWWGCVKKGSLPSTALMGMQSSIDIIEIVWRLLRKLNCRPEDVSIKCLLLHEDLNLDSPPYKRSGVGHTMLVIPALGDEKGWSLGFAGHWFSRTVEFRIQWETLFQENKVGSDWESYSASLSGWLRKIPSINICPPCIYSHKWTYIHMHIHTLLASLCTCAFIPASLVPWQVLSRWRLESEIDTAFHGVVASVPLPDWLPGRNRFQTDFKSVRNKWSPAMMLNVSNPREIRFLEKLHNGKSFK